MAIDKKRSERERLGQTSSSLLADIIDHSPNEIYVVDADTLRFRITNRRASESCGYSSEGLISLSLMDVIPEITHDAWSRLVRPLLDGKRNHAIFGASIRRKDGSEYPASIQLEYLVDGDSTIFVAFVEDLTARRTLETGQQLSDAVLATVIETAPDAIIIIDAKGTIESFSFAAEELFGYRAEEVIGQNVKMLMPNPYHDEHDGYLDRYLKTGEKRIIGIGRQVIALRKDGTEFPMELAVGEVHRGDKRLFTGFIRDISNRIEMEEQTSVLQRDLNHAARLTAMGEMASALAHEINQPLAAISNYAQVVTKLLGKEEGSDARIIQFNEKIAEQATRAGDIIRHLRQFVRRGEAEKSTQDINEVVREAAQMALIGAAPDGISVKFDLQSNLPETAIDRIQVQQVVVNLIRNAIDSLNSEKQQNSDLKRANSPKEITLRSHRTEEAEIQFSVDDTGAGISEEILDKLFEPFATTKKTGMGIGLSVSKSIMEAHGGRLWAENNVEGGATFSFSLPIDEVDD